MSRKEKCCGTCAYHKHDDDVDFICTCTDSEAYGWYTVFLIFVIAGQKKMKINLH